LACNNNTLFLNRRQFAVAALGQVVLSVFLSNTTVANSIDSVHRMLRSATPNLDAANVVGLCVLDTLPRLAGDAKRHLSWLSQEVASPQSSFARDRSAYCKFVREKIRQDLLSDNIVTIDGWVMARSEAVFCAVVAQFNTEKIRYAV